VELPEIVKKMKILDIDISEIEKTFTNSNK